MIQKLKPADNIPGVTPLSTDSRLYSAYVTRNTVDIKFRPDSANKLTIELYSFETIEDNVKFETDVNSITVQSSFTATDGIIAVTSKSGNVSTYDYTIVTIPLTAALPLITTLADDAMHELKYIQNIKPIEISGATFNMGIISAKIGVPFTGSGIVVQAGSSLVFSSDVFPDNFLQNEKSILLNGVDKYIVVRNTTVEISTENSIFLKVIEATDYILEDAPTGLVDVNGYFYDKIGYRIANYFIPITDMSIMRRNLLYAVNADIPSICASYNLQFLDVSIFLDFENYIDQSFNVEDELLSWNTLAADNGFTEEDIVDLRKVLATRLETILLNAFDVYTASLTVQDTRTLEVRYKEWLEFNNIYDIYNYCKAITNNELETTNLGQQQENDIKRSKFVNQFTASFINHYFSATDLLFFIRRIAYFNSVLIQSNMSIGQHAAIASLNVLNVLYTIKTSSDSDNVTIAYVTEMSAKLFADNFHKFKQI